VDYGSVGYKQVSWHHATGWARAHPARPSEVWHDAAAQQTRSPCLEVAQKDLLLLPCLRSCHCGPSCVLGWRLTCVRAVLLVQLILEHTKLMLDVLALGYNVLLGDVDAVWLSNPFPHFKDPQIGIYAQVRPGA